MKLGFNFQPKGLKSKKGWYSRGYLPHFDGGEIPQFLTFRLFDSMPNEVLKKWREQVKTEKDEIIFRKNIENHLDNGSGSCFLKDEKVAKAVEDCLKYYHQKKYKLISWVIMPNHVHYLLLPFENVELEQATHSIKSFSASAANKILGRKGQFWQHETFDRYIRDSEHFESVIEYIENNPVKAGLCEKSEDWIFSSANKL